MPIDPKRFIATLKAAKLDFFTGVPDSLLKHLCAAIGDNVAPERHIIAANEGSAVGLACGYHLASGHYGVIYLQNSGEGNTVNPLASLADPDVYSIPLMLIIGWRGQPNVPDEPQHAKQGKITCTLLETMGIPYEVLNADGDVWETQLNRLAATMERESRPVALVVPKGAFDSYPFQAQKSPYPLRREDALATILDHLGPDDFVVSTTGKTSRELFELREANGTGHANDLLTVGSMGHAASIACGMALATSANVWCIDGDGAFLMHMGALAPICQKAPANFKYILNNNAAHESVGGQPTVADKIDVATILAGCGFSPVLEATTEADIAEAIERMKDTPRAALVISTHLGSRTDLGRPTTTPQQNKQALMEALRQHRSTPSSQA